MNQEHKKTNQAAYETTAVTNWLINDENTYLEIHSLLKLTSDPDTAGRIIEEYVAQNNPLADMNTLYSDLLNASLNEVDWEDIANRFLDE